MTYNPDIAHFYIRASGKASDETNTEHEYVKSVFAIRLASRVLTFGSGFSGASQRKS